MTEMERLFDRAEKEGLWFWNQYAGLWFSPKELRKEQERGRFGWGAVNWELRDPKEEGKRLEEKVVKAALELAQWKDRVKQEGKG